MLKDLAGKLVNMCEQTVSLSGDVKIIRRVNLKC